MNAMTNPTTENHYPNGAIMLLQEELARERLQESQRVSAHVRQARRLASARRWSRLATWASRRAEKASRHL